MYRYIHIKYINRIMLDGDNNNILYTYRYYSAMIICTNNSVKYFLLYMDLLG